MPSETPFRCFTLGYASGLSHKHWPRLENLVRGKHSGLLQKLVTYSRKKFYNIGPWLRSGIALIRITLVGGFESPPMATDRKKTWAEFSTLGVGVMHTI